MNVGGSVFDAMDVAVSGLKAYGKQMEVIGSNVANARTTDAGNGEPYRRLDVTFKSILEDGISGVEAGDVEQDMSEFQKILVGKGSPGADENGYLAMPNIDLPRELISLNMASRAYQTNAAMLKRYQGMVNSSLELLK